MRRSVEAMNQLGAFLVLIVVAAVTLAMLGGIVAWFNDEGRRIRRGLRKVLKGETHALILAQGSGRGAGFNFTSNNMAVAWDAGEWCLIYRIEELLGVELIVDGQVIGRAFRGEARRAVDALSGADRQVSLRLVFDDPQHADFLLELWSAARAGRRGALDAPGAVEEGNRWLARLESIFRRQPSPVAAARPTAPQSAAPQPAAPQPAAPETAAPRPAASAPAAPKPAASAPSAPEPVDEPVPEAEREPLHAAAAAPEPAPAPVARAAARADDTRQELPFDAPPWDDEDDQQALL